MLSLITSYYYSTYNGTVVTENIIYIFNFLRQISQIDTDCHFFYEARPVKLKFCLIGSTFYSSCHNGVLFTLFVAGPPNLFDDTHSAKRALRPRSDAGLSSYQINTNFKLPTGQITPYPFLKKLRWGADEKTIFFTPPHYLLRCARAAHHEASPNTVPITFSPIRVSPCFFSKDCHAKVFDKFDEPTDYNATISSLPLPTDAVTICCPDG